MQDTELFLSLAEIAGVFVGFGALISIRSAGASDAHETDPSGGAAAAHRDPPGSISETHQAETARRDVASLAS